MSTTSSSKVTIDTEASNNSILGQITLSSDNVDEESILGQYWMKDLITLNLVKIQNISKEEIKFWKDVIEEYLSPNEKGKENYTVLIDTIYFYYNKLLIDISNLFYSLGILRLYCVSLEILLLL